MPRIAMVASRDHYLAHMLPVWRALPAEYRGDAYLDATVSTQVPGAMPISECIAGHGPVLIAGGEDFEWVTGRPIIMMEHGVGQSYRADPFARDSRSYAGGNRPGVALFLCHEEGTEIFDPSLSELGWHLVDKHPTADQRREGPGLSVRLHGLPKSMSETVTPEHRYWARRVATRAGHRQYQYQYGEPHWVEARHLDWNTWVGYPIDDAVELDPPPLQTWNGNTRRFEAVQFEPFLLPEFWWLVGLWWGDGTLGGPKDSPASITWCLSDDHPEVRQRLISTLTQFGLAFKENRPSNGARMSTIYTCHAPLARWLATWKRGNSRKEPPAWVEQLPVEHQRQLLLGLFAADGYNNGTEHILSSIHLPMLLSVRRMLMRLGDVASIRVGRQERTSTWADGRRLNCAAEFTLRLNDSTFLGNLRREGSRKLKRQFIQDGFLWSRVDSVEPVEHAVFVPIQTATETYITAYGRSHNCPNDYAAAANRDAAPDVPSVVIGSPRVADLQSITAAKPPGDKGPIVVAFAFHWDCEIAAPESGSAFNWWVHNEFGGIARDPAFTVLGHGHPRAFADMVPHYQRLGIEPVRSFDEVLARAHVLVADNTSVMYEWAALRGPVVVVNSPDYRPDVHHGLRFWDAAGIGPQITDPFGVKVAVRQALTERPWPGAAAIVDRVLPPVESPATAAVDAIVDVLGSVPSTV